MTAQLEHMLLIAILDNSQQLHAEAQEYATSQNFTQIQINHACKKVTLYGLGGVGKGYLRNVKKRAPSGVHNLQGEKEWYDLLEKKGIVSRVCK